MWSVLFVNPVPTFFPEANKTNTPFGLSSCQTIAAGLLHEILILFPFSLIREATMIHQCTNHYRFYFHFNNKKKHCKTYHWLFPVFCNLFIDQQTPTLIQHTCPKYQCPHDEYWMTFKQKKTTWQYWPIKTTTNAVLYLIIINKTTYYICQWKLTHASTDRQTKILPSFSTTSTNVHAFFIQKRFTFYNVFIIYFTKINEYSKMCSFK